MRSDSSQYMAEIIIMVATCTCTKLGSELDWSSVAIDSARMCSEGYGS